MAKLITTFAARRDVKSATRLIAYVVTHPMALTFASADDLALIADARTYVA